MFGNQILDMAFGPWAADTLYCAVRLKIFTLLADKNMTAEELAEKTGTVPRLLTALLDACTGLGLLRKKGGVYMNWSLSAVHLVEGEPHYLGDIIDVMSVETPKWTGLYDALTGKEKGPGKTAETKREIPPHRFTMAMNNLAMLGDAKDLADVAPLSNARKMVDVGCGSGIYSIMLCRRYPNLHAELLDKKDVLETTKTIIEKNHLQQRMTTREADITKDSYGENLDAVLLSDVLYQTESVCLTILGSAYAALAPGGTLIVRGYYIESEDGGPISAFAPLFNLHQLLDDLDREMISVPLLCRWIEETGFKITKRCSLTERSYCVLAQRP
jgi:2-polyprenyl-3-methyl-5-hydroxy-6-metoxy-1,4-benzoquinol methylase/DNA-binding transcriptional ArsR family regulator